MPKVGDLVIFGEWDAPEAHCICRITDQENRSPRGDSIRRDEYA
jgi:hypothetical protein